MKELGIRFKNQLSSANLNAAGSTQITYMSKNKTMRIMRGNKGGVYLLKKIKDL